MELVRGPPVQLCPVPLDGLLHRRVDFEQAAQMVGAGEGLDQGVGESGGDEDRKGDPEAMVDVFGEQYEGHDHGSQDNAPQRQQIGYVESLRHGCDANR